MLVSAERAEQICRFQRAFEKAEAENPLTLDMAETVLALYKERDRMLAIVEWVAKQPCISPTWHRGGPDWDYDDCGKCFTCQART